MRSSAASFSALQRAEIAETSGESGSRVARKVSVLFNVPKLLNLESDRYYRD